MVFFNKKLRAKGIFNGCEVNLKYTIFTDSTF
ncbi:hypothetical protein SAMN05192550_0545 [Flavobacterium glycines]|uniref:Uncharacterized protein n=1 Tax=Flavobacterium glycines TaxID=551990 RepID=A0A1G8MLA0_9FLAO|nr:hypothetical protein SAMN05192550_0545 [Flavobacterium glycines]